MNLGRIDYLLLRLAQLGADLFQTVGDLESALLRRQLDAIPIETPIFVCGLARSGTTILLEELSKAGQVATHRYRDFPFLMTPWIWNRVLDWSGTEKPARERPHQDRIRITAESPEAFEEPIWQFFFPHLHAADAVHRLTAEQRLAEFDSFFQDHIRKILLIRGQRRYLSKGNYNVGRIEYLANLFPDARFIVPIRHPFTHVQSLMRQHALFTDYARTDPRVPNYLRGAGHYEFGPQRVPIRLTPQGGNRIQNAWQRGDDAAGYAMQWTELYRFVDHLRRDNNALAARIHIVRYEDFCDRPREVLGELLKHAQLQCHSASDSQALEHIAPPKIASRPADFRETVWRETEGVANRFGYSWCDEANREIRSTPSDPRRLDSQRPQEAAVA